eukprot:TRINITY_DN4236_c0_g1_i2.p1 TRINITY_DN4236_c0_g1~~TRINITY_DN4236_c0_g1_i2.p1  ORF type:complete len:982 (+),score=173.60 TRINITY_DN4236_c0_g1_i2:43-2988(+)
MSRKTAKDLLEKLDFVPTIDLDGVADDSPQFREKLSILNADLEDFSAEMKGFLKIIRQYDEAGREFGRWQRLVADRLLAIKIRPIHQQHQLQFHSIMSTFSGLLNRLSESLDHMLNDTHLFIYKPIEYYLDTAIEETKGLRKAYDRARDSYGNASEKLQSYHHSQSTSSMAKKERLKQDSDGTKHTLVEAAFDYSLKLVDLEKRKQGDFVEYIDTFIKIQLGHHRDSCMHLQTLDTALREARDFVSKEKDEWNTLTTQAAAKRKTSLMKITSTPESSVSSKKVEHEGFLFKKSRKRSMKEWKRRYFVIKNGKMYYSRNAKQEKESRGVMNLLLTTVKEAYNPDIPNTFEVISNEKSYTLKADSPEEMKEWIATIQNAIAAQLYSQQDTESFSIGMKSQYDSLQILWAHESANMECADCGASDPDWVSINLGCLVCIECSGIHRSLGVHVSKVRSLLLDRCDIDTLTYLKSTGNRLANHFWENTLPIQDKPLPKTTRSAKEAFIRAKYVTRRFLTPLPESRKSIEESLYDAILRGDFKASYLFTAHGASLDYAPLNPQHPTLVSAAIERSELVIADLLLLNDAPMHRTLATTSQMSGNAPPTADLKNASFQYAIQTKSLGALRLLLRRGTPDHRPSVGALYASAQQTHWTTGEQYLRAVLAFGYDLDIDAEHLEKIEKTANTLSDSPLPESRGLGGAEDETRQGKPMQGIPELVLGPGFGAPIPQAYTESPQLIRGRSSSGSNLRRAESYLVPSTTLQNPEPPESQSQSQVSSQPSTQSQSQRALSPQWLVGAPAGAQPIPASNLNSSQSYGGQTQTTFAHNASTAASVGHRRRASVGVVHTTPTHAHTMPASTFSTPQSHAQTQFQHSQQHQHQHAYSGSFSGSLNMIPGPAQQGSGQQGRQNPPSTNQINAPSNRNRDKDGTVAFDSAFSAPLAPASPRNTSAPSGYSAMLQALEDGKDDDHTHHKSKSGLSKIFKGIGN